MKTRIGQRLELLVVQDLFPSPLSQRATYVLPGAAYAERDGSYVNRADRLQSLQSLHLYVKISL